MAEPETGRAGRRPAAGGDLRGVVRAARAAALGLEAREPGDLSALLEAEPAAWLRRVPGRQTFDWPQAGEARLVVKRFRGGAWQDHVYERLRGGPVRSPGQREFENLEALAADGFDVPRAVAWGADARGRSLVVMERVPHAETLREHLEGGSGADRRALAARLVEIVAGLHRRGWYHRDLYLQHLLLPGDGRAAPLVLIDVGRARRAAAPARRWFVKDLGQLLHSTPAGVPRAARLRFLAGYCAARGIADRRTRRRWAREIEARRRRIAAHTPRYGED